MFTPQGRQRLRATLIRAAEADRRISGAALTGSAASGTEDRWSDIDLALGIAAQADLGEVMAEWTDLMYRTHGAVHHLDVIRDATVYRVFLLASTLQVDIAFAPAPEFGATGPTFRLLFGATAEQEPTPAPQPAQLIGLAWLYALHARSSLARGRRWQAEYMISGVRDQVLALACLRHHVPAVQGRGLDDLPPDVTAAIAGALVRSLDISELTRSFQLATEALLTEISLAEISPAEAGHADAGLADAGHADAGHADAGLADRLGPTLRELAGLAPSSAQRATGPASSGGR